MSNHITVKISGTLKEEQIVFCTGIWVQAFGGYRQNAKVWVWVVPQEHTC